MYNKTDYTMTDFNKIRHDMVENQLKPRGIRDNRVLEAMRSIPRHLFVPNSQIDSAYYDMALPIGEGQTISQPYMVAIMTELLECQPDNKVLEIGTGSGYQTAILASLVKEVYTIERIAVLSEKARTVLDSLGFKNVHFIIGDGSKGYEEAAPYDRIMVTAAAPKVPDSLLKQLSEGGILIAPVGERHLQQLAKARRNADSVTVEYSTGCVFVPLIGEQGWQQ